MTTFGSAIRAKRLQLKLTQHEVTKRLLVLDNTSHISSSYIHDLEDDKTQMTKLSRVKALSEILDIDYAYLCYLTGRVQNVEENISEDEFKLANNIFSNVIQVFKQIEETSDAYKQSTLKDLNDLYSYISTLDALDDRDLILSILELIENYSKLENEVSVDYEH